MKLLITGANGFVGQSLCRVALKSGFQVRGAMKSRCVLPPGVDSTIVGSIDGETNWTDALDSVEVVIHLAARVHVMSDESSDPLAEFRRVNVAGTEYLARSAAAAGVKRFVYVSSIKVNGGVTSGGQRFSEADVSAPQDPYGISKWEAEQALHRVAAETGLKVVIVRPPLVYGAGVKGNFAQMLKVLTGGIPLPFASVNNRRSLIYIGNLVDVLILCATHPAAANQTYLVSDGEDVSTPDLLRQLGVAIDHPARLFPCPTALLKMAGWLIGKSDQIERLSGSLRVDSSKIRRELGWMPPFTLEKGLHVTAEGYRDGCA